MGTEKDMMSKSIVCKNLKERYCSFDISQLCKSQWRVYCNMIKDHWEGLHLMIALYNKSDC